MKLMKRIFHYFYLNGKISVLNYLRDMPEQQLIEWGYSPALLAKGIAAWPWREDQQTEKVQEIEQKVYAEQQHVKQLNSFSDSDLADLGISRGAIQQAVRHGRPGIDKRDSKAA